MSINSQPADRPITDRPAVPPRHVAWIAGAVFTGAYLANGFVTGLFATRPLPLPDAPTAEVVAYFANERAATVASGATQLVSVLGLAVFAWAVARVAAPDWRRTVAGIVAVAAMIISVLLSWLLALIGPTASDGVILLVRDLNFYTGGVIHVVALGAFVATLTLLQPGSRAFGRGVRRFGAVAAVCALLSVFSIVFYYASIFLPVGRLLSMLWTVTAGVSIARGRRSASDA